ncbi:DUF4436 family protein [Streptomyces sp. NPDC054849]
MLIVVAVAVGSWLQFTERQALDTVHTGGSQATDRVDVEANVQRVDAAAREPALRVRVTARGTLGEEEGTAPVAELSLQTSAQTLGDLEFKAHERLTTRDVQVAVMWALAASVLIGAWYLTTRGEGLVWAALGWMAATLFALSAFRNNAPGTPPIGCVMDWFASLWAETVIALCLIAVVVTGVRTALRHDDTHPS